MALSVYSPENLADLLTDKVELTREEKIVMARRINATRNTSCKLTVDTYGIVCYIIP